MANIAFFLDFEEGHIFPTFDLAATLSARSHRVVYMGIPDSERLVREKGFEFFPILSEIYPLGSVKKNESAQLSQLDNAMISQKNNLHFQFMMRQNVLSQLPEQFRPDLIISNIFIPLEALILYIETQIPQVIFSPALVDWSMEDVFISNLMSCGSEALDLIEFAQQNGLKINTYKDLASPWINFPVIVACPRELEFPNMDYSSKFNYIEPSIRKAPSSGDFDWSPIPSDTKIVFTSLGSQNHFYGRQKVCSFYKKIVEVMRSPVSKKWHLILALGSMVEIQDIAPLPPSVTALQWVPQIEILQHASAIITHGGLGTIKEAIYYGVPIIVCPFFRDQPKNAERIKYHNLGVALDVNISTIDDISNAIEKVMTDNCIQASIQNMQKVFQEYEFTRPGVNLIEKIVTV